MTQNTIWSDDLLGFDDLAVTYTRLITTLSEASTISIEAGFGRGKTFFRENWASALQADGGLVIEIDAQTSDHSGDPVVTFLGALLRAVPNDDPGRWAQNVQLAKRIGLAGAKTVGKALLREGAEEVGDLLAGDADGARADILRHITDDTAKGLSKSASDLIDKQLAAESARDEIAGNLDRLHTALVKDRDTDRVIIFIDELDRCHPDYALALLEAMKLVFHHRGFVFVLFVNPDYLERLAAHRFGAQVEGEKYLDKFIDMRLGLPVNEDLLSKAVAHLFSDLPLAIPFGDHEEFSVERAARLAGELAPISNLSLRQIKAVLFKVRMACVVYAERPIDLALLIWLGFRDAVDEEGSSSKRIKFDLLPRSSLTERNRRSFSQNGLLRVDDETRLRREQATAFIRERMAELHSVSQNKFGFRVPTSAAFEDRVIAHLAPHYIPDHEAMLASVHKFAAPGTD